MIGQVFKLRCDYVGRKFTGEEDRIITAHAKADKRSTIAKDGRYDLIIVSSQLGKGLRRHGQGKPVFTRLGQYRRKVYAMREIMNLVDVEIVRDSLSFWLVLPRECG